MFSTSSRRKTNRKNCTQNILRRIPRALYYFTFYRLLRFTFQWRENVCAHNADRGSERTNWLFLSLFCSERNVLFPFLNTFNKLVAIHWLLTYCVSANSIIVLLLVGWSELQQKPIWFRWISQRITKLFLVIAFPELRTNTIPVVARRERSFSAFGIDLIVFCLHSHSTRIFARTDKNKSQQFPSEFLVLSDSFSSFALLTTLTFRAPGEVEQIDSMVSLSLARVRNPLFSSRLIFAAIVLLISTVIHFSVSLFWHSS